MDFAEIQKKYPKVANLMLGAQTATSDEWIGTYTSMIEYSNLETLTQWVECWIEVDVIKAAFIISKLSATKREKVEEFKNKVLEKVQSDEKIAMYKTILVLIKFQDFEKIKEIYLEICKQGQVDERQRIFTNNKIIASLHSDSDYQNILKYIGALIEINKYEEVSMLVGRLHYAVGQTYKGGKSKNQEAIEDVVQKLINAEKYYYAFNFMKMLGIKRYRDFLPKDKELSYFSEKLDGEKDTIANALLKKDLYIEENIGKFENISECYKSLIRYVEENPQKWKNKIVVKLYALLEIILNNLETWFQDTYILEQIAQISEEIEENDITIKNNSINIKVIKIIQDILYKEQEIDKIIEKIDKLGDVNVFRHKKQLEISKCLGVEKEQYRAVNLETIALFKNILENTEVQDIEKVIYIYMNTQCRYTYSIEDFVRKIYFITNRDNQKIQELFAQYTIIGYVKTQKNTYYKLRIKSTKSINKSRVSITEIQEEDNIIGSAFSAKISGYREIGNEVALTDLKIALKDDFSSDSSTRIRTYLKIYKVALGRKVSEKEMREANSVKGELHDRRIRKIVKLQLDTFLELENHAENIIDTLQRDKLNPFMYWYYKNSATYKNMKNITEKIKKFKEKVHTITMEEDETVTLIENYKATAIDNLKKVLQIKGIENKDIIFYYMNTVYKHLITLNEFLKILCDTRLKNQVDENGIIHIYNFFKYYPILFYDVKDTKIDNFLQIEAENVYDETLQERNLEKRYCKKTFIYFYDTKQDKILARNSSLTDFMGRSNELKNLEELMEEYLNNENEESLENLRKAPQIPELENKQFINSAIRSFSLAEYKLKYSKIFESLIGDSYKLKDFIEALGKNNLWNKDNNDFSYEFWHIDKNSWQQSKSIFLNNVKMEENVDIILFCYMNTFLKKIMPIDELFENLFMHNQKNYEKMMNTGKINLTDFNIEISVNMYKKEENFFYANDFFSNGKLKVKLSEQSEIDLAEKMLNQQNNRFELLVEEYDGMFNIVKCKIKSQIKQEGDVFIKFNNFSYSDYNTVYINALIALFDQNKDLNYILSSLKDIDKSNIYNADYICKDAVFDLKQKKDVLESLNKAYFKYYSNVLSKKVMRKDKRIDLWQLYDKSCLRYAVNIKDFLNRLCDNLGTGVLSLPFIEHEYTVQVRNKFNKKYANIFFVYVARYNSFIKAQLLNIHENDIVIGKGYVVNFVRYNKDNSTFVVNVCN